jgi:hypothetical protein
MRHNSQSTGAHFINITEIGFSIGGASPGIAQNTQTFQKKWTYITSRYIKIESFLILNYSIVMRLSPHN